MSINLPLHHIKIGLFPLFSEVSYTNHNMQNQMNILAKFASIVLGVSALSASVAAQESVSSSESVNDSIDRVLNEVVVAAPKVLHKSDMDLYIPSGDAKALSKNGLQLLQNLKIPSLTINEVLGTVSSLGNAVEIRINGRVASVEQMKALSPDDIKRVEWIENPGLKYKGANAVINLIVRNPGVGGSFMAQVMPALSQPWGQGNASLKINSGKSQWGFDLSGKLTDVNVYRDYIETFTYPDGQHLTRNESPLGGKIKGSYVKPTLSYSYIKPDTTVVYASLSGFRNFAEGENYSGVLTLNGGTDKIAVRDNDDRHGFTPSASLYVEQHLAKNRILAIDAGVSHYRGYTSHGHTESDMQSDNLITDVNTRIKDLNYSYAIEANYTEQWRTSRLTAGVSYSGSSNKSIYETSGGDEYHQNQHHAYFFGEYMKMIDKVSLTAGLGAQYSSFKLRETGRGNNSWNLRPRFTFSYRPGNASRWYLAFYSWQVSPTISETNDVAQQIDAFQWQIGNPNLKTYNTYRIDAQYAYNGNRVSGTLGVNYQFSPKSIAPFYEWQGERLVSSFENSRGRRWFSAYISPDVNIVSGWLNLSGYIRYGLTNTKGMGYNLTRYNWSGEVTAMAYHWGFNLMIQYSHGQSGLVGEREAWGEKVSLVMLAYNWQKWQFGAGALCPFNKYDQGSRLMNQYNTNEKHMRLDMAPMPFVQISYNLQWGRQKQGVDKRANADTSVEHSKAGSR